MVGPAILVRPVLVPGATHVDALLPRNGRWFCAHSGQEVVNKTDSWLPSNPRASQSHKRAVDMESIPVFYRGGHVISRKERPRRSSEAQSQDPLTLVVALDKELKATGDVYVDDGHSFAFQKGHYVHRDFVFDGAKLKNAVRISRWASPPLIPDGDDDPLACLNLDLLQWLLGNFLPRRDVSNVRPEVEGRRGDRSGADCLPRAASKGLQGILSCQAARWQGRGPGGWTPEYVQGSRLVPRLGASSARAQADRNLGG